MHPALKELAEEEREALKRRKQPSWTEPMLATLADEPFSDDNWIFERKLDGERCLVFREDGDVTLYSRNKKNLNNTYPEICDALDNQSVDTFIVDGEIVAFSGGRTSFSRLQRRMQIDDPDEARASSIAVYYYVFDVLHLQGYDCTGLALRVRKRVLKRALSFTRPMRYTTHRNGDGVAYHNEACRKGWEGIIGKRADAKYVHSRSRKWLKLKCVNRQEFVIGGYTEPQGGRVGFGALLIGFYEGGDLRYAGRVGTGFNDETLRSLRKELKGKARKTAPFAGDSLPSKGVHWVRPELVAEVAFTEWTDEDRLRHPRFLGLRRDKQAKDVHKEKA